MPIAIVQNGYAIFGIGDTLPSAIKDAAEWLDDKSELDNIPSHSSIDGEFYWTTCTAALAAEVNRRGGDIAYDERDDGTLCLPFEAQLQL